MPKKYSRFARKSLNNNGKFLVWLKNNLKPILICLFTIFLVFTLTFSIISIEKAKKIRHLDNVYIFTTQYKDENYLSQIEQLKIKHKDYVANIYVYENRFCDLAMRFKIPELTTDIYKIVNCIVTEKPFGEFQIASWDTSIEKVNQAILDWVVYEGI